MDSNVSSQLQVRFLTKEESYAVPDIPFSIPSSLENKGLNELLNNLLKENSPALFKNIEFDFIINGELLRVVLEEHLREHNLSSEATIDIEYFKRTPAPEPQDSLLHDDWVSSVNCANKWILTGSYDNSVNIWTTQKKLLTSQKYHKNIVKQVAWIDPDDPFKGFISVSHDLTALVWQWENENTDIKPIVTLKGHEKGIDSVGVSKNLQKVATGGWDTYLKIWSLDLDSDEPAMKRNKGPNPLLTRIPLHTLKGHKESISSIIWLDDAVICTASMDHTIKFWDAELCGIKNEIVGQKAFLDASWSPLSQSLLTCAAEKHIRLYDPRASEGSVVKVTFTSHNLWVSSVAWSRYNEFLFVSGGYDACVKLWDTRSPKAPLYNLEGHQGQVLSVDWSNDKYLVSGGSDNNVHIFRNKVVLK